MQKTDSHEEQSSYKVYQRSRILYFFLFIGTIAVGLASRSSLASGLPSFLRNYSGDTLWAMMAYFLFAFLFPAKPSRKLFVIALLFSWGIELSQLYQAEWINAIRQNRFAALVLGRGFLWSDLVCYTVGVCMATVVDRGICSLKSSSCTD